MAVCVLVTLAMGSLVYLFLTDNFSLAYVVGHSNRDLPTFYKFAALWSGQEGSLMFWSWLLSIYVFSVLYSYRAKHPELMPYVGVVLASVQLFFLILNVFIASPFKVLGALGPGGAMQVITQADGKGLTPLLQYPEMVIHPPMLYSGYTGFSMPFAFALAALLGRYPGEKWIHVTRKWTMIAWCFQSAGILLGAHWAYAVLGWGGYWAWDPVENASLMPWLTGTAFLHSVMMQEKRGMLRVWNVWLVFSTFLLCILGTFLTRSGVVSSVHAFAQSNIGPWFVGFLGLIVAVCILAFLKNRDYLRSDNQLDSMVSRESSFLFNNLILLVACVAVLSGTLFPVLSEWVQGTKISVGPPFFNNVNIPIGLFLLFLTGVGPLFAWRKTSLESLKKAFVWPVAFSVVAAAALVAAGMRSFYAVMSFTLCVFVVATIVQEFYKGSAVRARNTGESMAAALCNLTLKNKRGYGGYIFHFRAVVIFVGLTGNAFNQEASKTLRRGESLDIGRYSLKVTGYAEGEDPNYTYGRLALEAYRDGKLLRMMRP